MRSTRMATSSNERVFRSYPLGFWSTGALLVALVAGPLGPEIAETAWERVLFLLVGLGIIGFGNILTITVDRVRGTLHLRYRSVFRLSTKVYPLNEICFVRVAQDREGERMYRVELTLC